MSSIPTPTISSWRETAMTGVAAPRKSLPLMVAAIPPASEVAVTPRRVRVPVPVVTLPPIMVNESTVWVAPFRSKRAPLVMNTSVVAGSTLRDGLNRSAQTSLPPD